MFNNKKGTELSMNVVIIAAIAILVLVILAMFVFRSSNRVNQGTGCEGIGGQCLMQCADDYPIRYFGADDSCSEPYHCCIPFGSDNS